MEDKWSIVKRIFTCCGETWVLEIRLSSWAVFKLAMAVWIYCRLGPGHQTFLHSLSRLENSRLHWKSKLCVLINAKITMNINWDENTGCPPKKTPRFKIWIVRKKWFSFKFGHLNLTRKFYFVYQLRFSYCKGDIMCYQMKYFFIIYHHFELPTCYIKSIVHVKNGKHLVTL